ncbi:MAG: DNA replication and repair protein RecF [candidate division WOR-3 bacterium]|nr:MAG: DNA replication and repair protein RecF [candidate division WOR-3 bacterium]
MAISRISLRGFRNLKPAEIRFAPDSNYLFGPNGAGKTNLLEAVHYLAIGRSFRRAGDREMLGFGAELLQVAGSDEAGKDGEIRFDGREKRVLLDRTRLERLSDYLGWLPVVVLLLDDVELVRGAPSMRRGFLDMAIAKTDREYIGLLSAYRRALTQRNRLLVRGGDEESHAAWEEELVRTGVPVLERRRPVTEVLLASATGYFAELRGEKAAFSYRASLESGDDTAAGFRQRLAETRKRSVELGRTLVGPHRDDLRIRFGDDDRDMRRFGSVGEQRLAAVALRLAEADLLLGSGRQRPVFLLDEIGSELDPARSARVLDLVRSKGQVLYAAARRFDNEGKEFRVEAGQVEAVS